MLLFKQKSPYNVPFLLCDNNLLSKIESLQYKNLYVLVSFDSQSIFFITKILFSEMSFSFEDVCYRRNERPFDILSFPVLHEILLPIFFPFCKKKKKKNSVKNNFCIFDID